MGFEGFLLIAVGMNPQVMEKSFWATKKHLLPNKLSNLFMRPLWAIKNKKGCPNDLKKLIYQIFPGRSNYGTFNFINQGNNGVRF